MNFFGQNNNSCALAFHLESVNFDTVISFVCTDSFLLSLIMMSKYIILQIGQYVDMVKEGIIDPLKVIRTALVDAAR